MTYDVVDLWFDHHERLPAELSAIALEQLAEEPSRLGGRVAELVDKLVADWQRRPVDVNEVRAVAALLTARTRPDPIPDNQRGELGVEVTVDNYPLVILITRFMRGVRSEKHFSANFKVINAVLLPYIVRSFPGPSK